MFRKSFDTVIIAILFVIGSFALNYFHFWKFIGLEEPHSFVFVGLMFLTLVVVLQHTLFEPFMAISSERVVQTTDKRKLADERKIQAEGILKSYEAKILAAKIEAMKQRERIAIDAEATERKVLSAAKERSQKDLETAVAEINIEVEKTRAELHSGTGSLVSQLVDEVLSPNAGNKSSTSNKSVESRM